MRERLSYYKVFIASNGNKFNDIELSELLENKANNDNDFSFFEVTGYYKGEKEQAYCCSFSDIKDLNMLLSIAYNYSQESVLFCDKNNIGYLYYVNDSKNPILLGTFKEVGKAYIEQFNVSAYTVYNGKYYTTV